MKKFPLIIFFLLILIIFSGYLFLKSLNFQTNERIVTIPNLQSERAKSLVASARAQIGIVTEYSTEYFPANEIPENSGACADVIWRAMQKINYDLRNAIEEDLAKNPNDYPATPPLDSNVNFRRVKIIRIFLGKYAQKLSTEVIPADIENLQTWQGGDIVTFAPLKSSGLEHIAIISDKRRPDGVPLIIHNYGEGVKESDYLLNWPAEITGHYKFF